MLMENEIRDILRDILRRGDNILGTMPETDPYCMFLRTLVNYARAKRESEGALGVAGFCCPDLKLLACVLSTIE
jgi:hypothetical protein